MSIRFKIVLVVLPLMIVTLILGGASSYFVASTGITRIAKDFLGFKASELQKYAEGQWLILLQNDLADRPEMVKATQAGIENFASSMIRSGTEVIFAIDNKGQLAMSTGKITIGDEERAALLEMKKEGKNDLTTLPVGGVERVVKGFGFEPYDWYFLVSEVRDTFYHDVDRITYQTLYILAAASLLSILLLLIFARHLVNPLSRVATTMKQIISSNDLSQRVNVEYKDETGQLAHTFNLMVSELEKAYNQIKSYAFSAVVAQKKESRIRNIFQKYVPQELIDRFYENPESMLVGDNRVLSILFSDIRSFSTISEGLMPDDLVNSLNQYFSVMVDIIMNRGGIVDKYIGDAIMAFFGAPVKHENDALESVRAGIEMVEGAAEFNRRQLASGKPEFRIGVGINYGIVTVGNIGTEKKMDYTVIGDMVNLASRLEGLTKYYRQELIISESLYMKVKEDLPCRLLDTVAVKGKKQGTRIYTVQKTVTENEDKAWALHNSAMSLYYNQNFEEAITRFRQVQQLLPDDPVSSMLIARCEDFLKNPPAPDWNGVHVMKEK